MKSLLILCLLFAGCGIQPIRIGWNTKAAQIALHCPKMAPGDCQAYAENLSRQFSEAGIPHQIMGFSYTGSPMHPVAHGRTLLHREGNHAEVVFLDDGRWEMIDNQSRWPKWLHDDSFASVQSAVGSDYALTEGLVLQP